MFSQLACMTFPFVITFLYLYNHYEATKEKFPWQLFLVLHGTIFYHFLLIPKASIWDFIRIINTSVLSTWMYGISIYHHFSIFVYPLWDWTRETTMTTVLHFGRHRILSFPPPTQNLNLWLLHIPEAPVSNQLACMTFPGGITYQYEYNCYDTRKEK